MRIAYCSDLHLEFGDIILKNDMNADVLVIAGDTCIAETLHDHPANHLDNVRLADLGRQQERAVRFREFFKRCSFQFPHTLVVAGNHEFYHGNWYNTINIMVDELQGRYPNVHFLEDMSRKIGDITFVGATLWTDMNGGDPLTKHAVIDMMSDFKHIRNDQLNYMKLRPDHTIRRHLTSKAYINAMIEGKQDEKFVVITHHAPSFASIAPYYIDEHLMNGAYASDLSSMILDRPQIKSWIHGHIHYKQEYVIGPDHDGCVVRCNPRGYAGYEIEETEFKLEYFDL